MPTNLLTQYAFATPSAGGSTTLVSATVGFRIIVLQVCVITSSANNVSFQTSTGPTAISATFPLANNGGFVLPYSQLGWFQTNIGDALAINMSAGVSTGVQIVYCLSNV